MESGSRNRYRSGLDKFSRSFVFLVQLFMDGFLVFVC